MAVPVEARARGTLIGRKAGCVNPRANAANSRWIRRWSPWASLTGLASLPSSRLSALRGCFTRLRPASSTTETERIGWQARALGRTASARDALPPPAPWGASLPAHGAQVPTIVVDDGEDETPAMAQALEGHLRACPHDPRPSRSTPQRLQCWNKRAIPVVFFGRCRFGRQWLRSDPSEHVNPDAIVSSCP